MAIKVTNTKNTKWIPKHLQCIDMRVGKSRIEHTHTSNGRGWLFLRHSAWMSLILSLLQAGLWKVSLRKILVSREDTFWIEQTSKDTSLLTICEQLVFCVLKDGKSSVLLKILTSLFEHACRGTAKRCAFCSWWKRMRIWCTVVTKFASSSRLWQFKAGRSVGEARS